MQLQAKFDLDHVHKPLAVLGYFLGIFHSQNNDYDYCNMLRVKIIPLIRLIVPEKVNEWVKEKKDYIRKRERLERQVIEEIEVVFEILKQRLEKERLLDAPGIVEACTALESILKFEPEDGKVWVMPEQYRIAFQRLKNFCYVIIQLKRKNLIDDYLDEFVCNSNIYWSSDIYFNEKSFVPSYFQLYEINESFSKSASMAWDKLFGIEWGWQTNRQDDFRKKKLDYDFRKKGSIMCNYKATDRSRKLLNTNGYWYEMKAVKERRKSILFTREYFARYTNLVISQIDSKLIEFIADDVACLPEAVRLSLEDDRKLRLIVQWAEGFCEVKNLHTFHDPDYYSNVRYDFFKNMIQKPRMTITIDPVSGAKATKYLQAIGLCGVLDTLFVANKRGDKAALTSDQIDLERKPETVICDLKNHLETLKTLEWRTK